MKPGATTSPRASSRVAAVAEQQVPDRRDGIATYPDIRVVPRIAGAVHYLRTGDHDIECTGLCEQRRSGKEDDEP